MNHMLLGWVWAVAIWLTAFALAVPVIRLIERQNFPNKRRPIVRKKPSKHFCDHHSLIQRTTRLPWIILDGECREVQLNLEYLWCPTCEKNVQCRLQVGTVYWNRADIEWLSNGGPVRDVL